MSDYQGKVRLLSEDVANKIAAGEVVERPSSVVKELVENALDAGARRVTVEISQGGRTLIRVSDDGFGMEREDALLALQRHATSKIKDAKDLDSIFTLGFRGEALPSIASVSRFELVTAPASGKEPTKITVSGGADLKCATAARARGTTVAVSNLFYCVPARAKFLKTDATEMGHIASFMQNVVLANPRIGFRYCVDGTEVFNLPPQAEDCVFMDAVLARIRQLRGKDFANSLIPFLGSGEGRTAEGFVSPWTIGITGRKEIFLFVNKRPVRCPWLAALLKRAYGTLLPPERYPYAFVFLSLDPAEIDINVHPAKLDIRFRRDHLVQDLIARAVSEALRADRRPPEISLREEAVPQTPSGRDYSGGYKTTFSKPQEVSLLKGEKLSVEDWKKLYSINDSKPLTSAERAETYTAASEEKEEEGKLTSARALAQAGGMYIVAELEGRGIGLIDQHAAHERINYEKAIAAFEMTKAPSQNLLIPETLEFSPEQFVTLSSHLDDLRRAGFSIDVFGKNALKLDAVPAFLEVSALPELFADMERELSLLGATARVEEIRRRLALVMVCRKSIKFHHQLSLADCQALLNELMATKTPWTCPHGRPTIIMLTYAELEKRFGRGGF